MSNFLTPYEAVLSSAVEAANAYLDLEGGPFILALISELLQELAAAGNHKGAVLVVQQVCGAVDVECPWADQDECGEETAEVWPVLFAEILAEQVETVIG